MMLLLDNIFRPLLRLITGFEKHYSYAKQQRSFMIKLYIYSLGNRLIMLYSRNIENIADAKSFLAVVNFTVAWRHEPYSGAFDIFSLVMTEIFWNNLFDIVIFWVRYGLLRSTAYTPQ